MPQNSSVACCSSRPISQPLRPSCPRQTRIASHTAWLVKLIRCSRCPTVNPCGRIARHPLVLMSTVYPSACSVRPASVQATATGTREFRRIPARIFFIRCSKLSSFAIGTLLLPEPDLLAALARLYICMYRQKCRLHTNLLVCSGYEPRPHRSMELPAFFHRQVTCP